LTVNQTVQLRKIVTNELERIWKEAAVA